MGYFSFKNPSAEQRKTICAYGVQQKGKEYSIIPGLTTIGFEEENVILFLTKLPSDKYQIGISSKIINVEEIK